MSRGERPHVGWEGWGGRRQELHHETVAVAGGEARGGQRHVETARVWGGWVDGCVMKEGQRSERKMTLGFSY